mgnify:CR=1 FL=1
MNDIFSQPANTLSPADLLRAAAAKMDEQAKPDAERSDREIARWQGIFEKSPKTARDRLSGYLMSLSLGADFGEARDAHYEKLGLTKFVQWARDEIKAVDQGQAPSKPAAQPAAAPQAEGQPAAETGGKPDATMFSRADQIPDRRQSDTGGTQRTARVDRRQDLSSRIDRSLELMRQAEADAKDLAAKLSAARDQGKDTTELTRQWKEAREAVGKHRQDATALRESLESHRATAMLSRSQPGYDNVEYHVNEANREKTDALQAELRRQGDNFTITPVALPANLVQDAGERERGAGPANSFELAERVSGLFGKEIVWMQAQGTFPVIGITGKGPKLSKFVFIDPSAVHPAHTILGHELTHHMEQDAPGVFGMLKRSLMGLLRNHEEYRIKYNLPEGMSDSQVTDEMIGDLMGDNFDSRVFWNRVAKESG